MNKKQEALHLLESLKQEGIEELYLPAAASKPASKKTPVASSQKAKAVTKEPMSAKKEALLSLRQKVLKCTLCQELAATRKNVVFGAGNIHASLMFVGEAPGRDEDEQGLPFVGRAGQLLTKIIESIGLTRRQVFIGNTLKCRPPQNRAPQPDEILNCQPFLQEQIKLIRPKIICALGTFAAQTLLKTGEPISKLRGKFHDWEGCKVMCTYHPAYLLRNPEEKRKVWEDMKKIKKEMESV